MLRSMTGFGEATGESDGIYYTVEIKTVNNRYLKTSLRLADTIAFCEEDIEKLIRRHIRRGTINYSIRLQNVSGPGLFDIDENSLNQYMTKLRDVARMHGINSPLNLSELLALPGVVVPVVPDPSRAERMRETVMNFTVQALDKLRDMRELEGKSLLDDLLGQTAVIAKKLGAIREKAPVVVTEYHDKLGKRVGDLLAQAQLNIDADTLAREVAIYADRCDISEELTRLDSHIRQFENACRNEDNPGRRLDFISQEMLREANTIGSKAGDSDICRCVIDIKCAIDRIKEQVQNVE